MNDLQTQTYRNHANGGSKDRQLGSNKETLSKYLGMKLGEPNSNWNLIWSGMSKTRRASVDP